MVSKKEGRKWLQKGQSPVMRVLIDIPPSEALSDALSI
jgi:hypothetical protein